jgi:hypothetical protein
MDPAEQRVGEVEDPVGDPRQIHQVAPMDEAGTDLALGLVLRPDLPGSLVLRSPPPDRPAAGLHWGSMGLDEVWAERHATASN